MRSALVLGAGPGGLSAALSLHARGYSVQVLERAPALLPVGAGLTLFPNGLRALDRIDRDLGQMVVRAGSACDVTLILDEAGALLHRSTSDLASRYGYPMVNLRWSRLVQILAAALPRSALQLGRCARGLSQDSAGVTLHLDDGTTQRADLLVAADGVHSLVREIVVGDGPPRYTGRMSWRMLLPYREDLLSRNHAAFYLARAGQTGKSVGLFDLGDCLFVSGGAQMDSPPTLGSAQQRAVAQFSGFAEPIATLFARSGDPQEILERPIWDRPGTQVLCAGRVALLGDAAHPMEPSLGQGANTAFEDALCLGECLARTGADEVEAALRAYAAQRLPRVGLIQARSSQNGATSHSAEAAQFATEAIDRITRQPGGFEHWLFADERP